MRHHLLIILLAALVGCAPAPPPTTPEASPAVVASPSPAAEATGPNGETLVEQSAETRFQLDLHVPNASLARFIPSGWSSDVATTGAARDVNLRVIFIASARRGVGA